MLPHVLPAPTSIHIPKFLPDYNSNILSRPRLVSNASFLTDISHLVSSSISPAHTDSPPDIVDDDQISSPQSPQGVSANYHYVNRGSGSFSSPISPTEMYNPVPSSSTYPNPSHSFPQPSAHQETYAIHPANAMTGSGAVPAYLSDSPSPVEMQSSSACTQPLSAPHPQEHFSHTGASDYPPEGDRFTQVSDSLDDRYSRNSVLDKYPSGNPSLPQNLLDHRRMSEPAILGSANQYATPSSESAVASRYQQLDFGYPQSNRSSVSAYVPALQRGASIGSLRDLRHQHFQYPPSQSNSSWKPDDLRQQQQQQLEPYHGVAGDEPLSPFQPSFSGGVLNSPTGGLQYSPIAENPYGPSPPGTGTSTSSNAPANGGLTRIPSQPQLQPQSHHMPTRRPSLSGGPADANNSKTYSFVALPGNAVKKRPRRRYDEIERLYQCSWPDCTKAYGTLNHLNAHVTMQKHGMKRSPNEFKELRKQWRKAKKEAEAPMSGPLRRSSMNLRHSERDLYEVQRYGSGNLGQPIPHRPLHMQHPSVNIPNSVSISHAGSDERYPLSVDEIRFPDDRGNMVDYANVAAKQRYNPSTVPSWHGAMTPSSSRSNLHQQYISSSMPMHPHHSHLPQLSINSHSQGQQMPSSPPHNMPMNRLPPDSTLLTPLPGYQPPSLLPPLQGNNDLNYPPEGYELYDDDSQRPGTGHGSISRGSGDEYDHRS